MAMYISRESVPAALPQGNEPMEWIHCMLVIEWGLSAHNMISTVQVPWFSPVEVPEGCFLFPCKQKKKLQEKLRKTNNNQANKHIFDENVSCHYDSIGKRY